MKLWYKEPVWVTNGLSAIVSALVASGILTADNVSGLKTGGVAAVIILLHVIAAAVARSKVSPVPQPADTTHLDTAYLEAIKPKDTDPGVAH